MLERLVEALQGLPQTEITQPVMRNLDLGGHFELDAEIRLNVSGTDLVLGIEIKNRSVYPRDVQQILWQISKYARLSEAAHRGAAPVPFLAAESISLGAKELLRSEKIGYFDTGGSLFVPAEGAYIFIEKPPPKTLAKSVRSLFKGKRAQVLHALLMKHHEWFGVKTLAELAGVAPSTASETLIALERFDWLRSTGQGPTKERSLAEPRALLDEWSRQLQASRQRAERRYYVPKLDQESLVKHIANACDEQDVTYAITREAAAQRYTPFLSSLSRVACRMATGRAGEQALAELDVRIVNEGANLIVIETASQGEFLFRERVDNVWLASPVQVYLDLLRGDGRAKDMAEHLRRERIGF